MFTNEEFEGLSLEPLTKQLAEYFEVPGGRGLLVTEVRSGSDAEKAGFKAGDIVTKVNGVTVHETGDIRDELDDRSSEKSKEVPFDVLRKGKPMTIKLSVEADDDDDDYSSLYVNPHGTASFLQCVPSPVAQLSSISDLKGKLHKFRSDLKEEVRELKDRLKAEIGVL
jgi:membrane-associated protease RseP (regulator of RpoE activity)